MTECSLLKRILNPVWVIVDPLQQKGRTRWYVLAGPRRIRVPRLLMRLLYGSDGRSLAP